MKFRRTFRFHGLSRPRIRQTWNKYNLYNLLKNTNIPILTNRTFFQQKWIAKSLTRGYHGEHIKERQWERMFSRRINSVVNMNPRYMALHDGSEQAAGRGSGLARDPARKFIRSEEFGPDAGNNLVDKRRTPFMGMTFAPMERRLDIAVFRAMFASSARQARQFVVHGAVTVNGKKMIYPGYLLNPGDLFQVDMDHVLYATGAPKNTRRNGVKKSGEASSDGGGVSKEEREAAAKQKAINDLPLMAERAKKLVTGDLGALSLQRKRELRAFVRDAHRTLEYLKEAQGGAKAEAEAEAEAEEDAEDADGESPKSRKKNVPRAQWESVVNELADMLKALPASATASESTTPPSASDESSPSSSSTSSSSSTTTTTTTQASADADASTKHLAPQRKADLSAQELERFQALLKKDQENPYDPSKPYKTPWQPRLYMEHFAYIPRYLEVNPNICAAVYLRHPVARPGQAEVPSPFPEAIHQLAFNWYLRRR